MPPVACPSCQSKFDVSHLAPGTKFKCGACGVELQTPSGTPAARGPAPRSAPPGGASRRGPPRRQRPEPRPRSNTPLILAGVGGAVVVVAIVLVVVLSGGSESPEQTTPVVETPSGPSPAEQRRELKNRMFSAKGNVGELRGVYLDAKEQGQDEIALQVARAALSHDSDLDWAHEAIGDVRFDPRGLPDEDEVLYPTPDWVFIQEARHEGWLKPDHAKKVEEAKKRFREHMERLDEDGHYRKICHWMGVVGKHPVFRNYKYKTVETGPNLVFVQHTGDPKKAKALEKRAKEKSAVFTCLYENFMKAYGEKFGITSLVSTDYDKDVVMKCWVFADRKTMDEYHKLVHLPIPPSVSAYYMPHEQWMMIPAGVTGSMGKVRGQDMDVNVTLHEGTHQLMHHVSKRIVEEELGEEILWTDRRLNPESVWFREGMAEYFGSAVAKGDTWELYQLNHYRLQGWKVIRERKLAEWTLEELLNVKNNAGFNVPGKPWMPSQFYGQSWALVHFLNHYEDGKYREKFYEYMKKELSGRSGLKVVKEVFGLDEIKGSEFEKDYWKYCDEVLKKHSGG